MSGLSLRKKGILIVGLPAVVSFVFLFGSIYAWHLAETEAQERLFSAKVSALASRMQLNYYQAILQAREWHNNRSEQARDNLDKYLNRICNQEKALQDLVRGHEKIESLVQPILRDSEPARSFLLKIRNGASKHFGGDLDPRIFKKTSMSFMEAVTDDFNTLNMYADDLVRLSDENGDNQRRQAIGVMIAGSIANALLAIALGVYFSRNITRRIGTVKGNAVRLASGMPLTEPLRKLDEISDLDASFHDMAEALAEAQHKEQALLDNATDVLCSIDSELRFVSVSAAALKVWGLDPEELIGSRVAQLLAVGTADDAIRNLETNIVSATKSSRFDGRLKCKDGRIIDAQFSCYWSSAEQMLFCVVRDVTREREFERIKQQLMDTIAHDLRSPIASIKIVLETLTLGQLGELSDKGLDRVGKAEASADRLLRLVNDLLDYEKFASGHFTLDLQDQSLQDILHSSELSVEALSEKKKIRVRIDGEDLAVRVDSDRLTQTIVNLLSNAIKFSPDGSEVKMSCVGDGKFALVEISDSGPGVPDNMKDQIFERFKQVESTSRQHKGTGLGLPIARQIVESHGGNIGVRDNVGGGTIFWFTVPLAEVQG